MKQLPPDYQPPEQRRVERVLTQEPLGEGAEVAADAPERVRDLPDNFLPRLAFQISEAPRNASEADGCLSVFYRSDVVEGPQVEGGLDERRFRLRRL